MKTTKHLTTSLATVAVAATTAMAAVTGPAYSTVGVGGYDLVSYHVNKKPLRGNGNHVAVHDGVAYLFSSEENRDVFTKAPDKYLPAYGGYCAFGVAVNKKFVGDPDVWEIVDGRLYLNLDNDIKQKWVADVPGYIRTANTNWKNIRDRDPAEL